MARLTLLTFNIAHGRGLSLYQGFKTAEGIRANLSRIAELLARARADIVALQEVDEDSHWTKRINLLDCLKNDANFPHGYLGVNNRREGRRPLAYGNAILSRHPVRSWKNSPFGTATLGEKGFLYAEVDIGGHPLPIVNLHLNHRSRIRRIHQIERVIEFVRTHPHPTRQGQQLLAPIICGDFNTHSQRIGDAVRHLFQALLTHGEYEIFPHPTERTFPAYLPSRALDFVLVPRPYRVRRCEVLKAYLSDHRPVLVELEFDS